MNTPATPTPRFAPGTAVCAKGLRRAHVVKETVNAQVRTLCGDVGVYDDPRSPGLVWASRGEQLCVKCGKIQAASVAGK